MSPLLVALAAAAGMWLMFTSIVLKWKGAGLGPGLTKRPSRRRFSPQSWLAQAGLGDVSPKEFMAVVVALSLVGAVVVYVAFGGIGPALVAGLFAGTFPVDSFRRRRRDRRRKAQEAWPQMIDEMRVQTSSLGRSIPRALFDVGLRGPEELRGAFEAAQREWLLTTDLDRALLVLKDHLADPTADMVCETLLIAHELGGSDLDHRLDDLAQDRRQDMQGRKDAHSRQAGARFARLFVLVVPAGMAMAGMSIGDGRDAYGSAAGQMVVMAALGLVISCWLWAGSIMRLPEPDRVFDR